MKKTWLIAFVVALGVLAFAAPVSQSQAGDIAPPSSPIIG